jgi:hypothetical protein
MTTHIELVNREPETEFEVSQATNLTTREMPVKDEHAWMRCQLGMWTLDEEKREIFVLKAHGNCWRSCWKQWRELEERRVAAIFG